MRLGATVRLESWQVDLELPPQWRGVSKLLYTFREDYEPELALLDRLLPPGGVFIDCGASIGIYSLVASRVVGAQGCVISFEPGSAAAEALEHNLKLNGIENVRLFHAAASDRCGRTLLRHESDPGRNSLVSAMTTPKAPGCSRPLASTSSHLEEIEATSLDDTLEACALTRLDMIKMDVEGAEELVLRGADRTIQRFWPHVIFEVNPKAAGRLGLDADGAWNFLSARGYEFCRMTPGGTVSRIDAMPGGANVVAIHPRRECASILS
jgi:FkbM family methyltransferase